jgi:hypothetical protein
MRYECRGNQKGKQGGSAPPRKDSECQAKPRDDFESPAGKHSERHNSCWHATLQHFSRRNGLVNRSEAIQQKYDRYK